MNDVLSHSNYFHVKVEKSSPYWKAILWSQSLIIHCEIIPKSNVTLEENEEAMNNLLHSLMEGNQSLNFQSPKHDINVHITNLSSLVQQILEGERTDFILTKEGTVLERKESDPLVILSGSFNPLHEGHISLFQVALDLSSETIFKGRNVLSCFEISIMNVDKPPLEHSEILNRIQQFAGRYSIAITSCPTFFLKARRFPNSIFIVGYDTALRILQKKYYNNSEEKMIAALDEFRGLRCKFMVAGRMVNQEYFPADLLQVPDQLQDLFIPIPTNQFRVDISSTEIRAKRLT